MTTTASANDIRITRVYDAPRALVWDAWTDLQHVSQWWGPRGFTITTHSKDLRPGGHWDYVMHGPDGVDYPNFARYHEVVPRERLVYDHGAASADAKPLFRVTVSFRDLGDKTEMEMTMTLESAEAARQTRQVIKTHNGNSTWDRLGEYLAEQSASTDIFLINRTFDVGIDTMFDAWTAPEQLSAWLAPTGFTMQFHRVDIRSGGESFYSMTNGQFTMYGRAQYLEVRRPDLLRYAQWFTDANEQMSRHPMAPTWPAKMLTNVQFTAEGAAQTRVTIRWEVYGDATPEERATFHAAKAGMTMGWTGSFDKLDAHLESQRGS